MGANAEPEAKAGRVERTRRRRRRRAVLVPLLGIGVAAWAAHRTLADRRDLTTGWQALPPAPVPPPVPDPLVADTDLAAVASAAPAPGNGAVTGVRGGVPALGDGSSPDPAFTVKGKSATRVFHTPGGPYYTRARADVWFRSADDARAAGFTERVRRSAIRENAETGSG